MYRNRFLAGVLAGLLGVVLLCGVNKANAADGVTDSGVLLTVIKTGTGDGTVTPSTGTLTFNGSTGTGSYATNSQVILTAVAGAGSRFNGWLGCDVTNGAQCTVTMSGVKSVFVDFKVAPPKRAKRDFNNDGKSDLLMQSSSTHDVAVWLMDGTTKAKADYAAKGVPANWKVRAAEDFDGDGKADVLWHNTDTGDVYIWLMNGTSTTSGAFAAKGVTSDWQVKGSGDFDGDGKNDVLWQNTSTGAVYVWLMDGNTQKAGGYLVKSMQADWQIKGIGDFDGDDKADVLWQNQKTGDVYLWLMDGVNIKKGDYISRGVPSTWHIQAVADYNGDGKADIHWQDANNNVYVWLMDGTNIVGGDFVKPKGSSSTQLLFKQMTEGASDAGTWNMQAVGDYNGDGMNDMLWQNSSTGAVYMWFMDGTTINSIGSVDQGVPSEWSIY
ncbi:MAG: VCBS repeat-containing protein [Nitrospirae bacterium]|nr:VCBS repeat-containing protein [Nitrospirota bacterium]MBF0592562.1 VCBS repeat-containing protein [Nitrospirota bacterium]